MIQHLDQEGAADAKAEPHHKRRHQDPSTVGKTLPPFLGRHDDAGVTSLECRLLRRDLRLLQKIFEEALIYCRGPLQFAQMNASLAVEPTLPSRLTHRLLHGARACPRKCKFTPDSLGPALRLGGNAPHDIPL